MSQCIVGGIPCIVGASYLFCVGLKVIGRDEKWNGGDYMSAPGGGQKVRLLKTALQEMTEEDKIILFIDR